MTSARLPILFALIVVGASRADAEVIGTIELTLDGEEQTWYVLESPADSLPNALWLAMDPGRGVISVTAFDRPDIDLVRHEASGSAVPDGSAPALVFAIAFPVAANEYAYSLPTEPDEGPAAITLLKDWANPVDSFTLSDGPGEIRLTSIDANIEGASQFTGTFKGVIRRGSGETRAIENGRFEFEGVRFFKRQ